MQTARISGSLLAFGVVLCALSPSAQAQSDARQRQAAAEAYDQATAAYLSNDYEKAAEWFETANRLSPAAPALIQAARAHQQAGHAARAATLALRLTLEHGNDASAMQVGQGILDQLASQLVRVEVTCDACTLDADGTLQESQAFFVDPGGSHSVTASFETGERRAEVSGQAGETKTLEFQAPPPQEHPTDRTVPLGPEATESKKPLPPIVTFIGAGVTAALLAGSIVSTLDMNAGVDPWKSAVNNYNACVKKNPANPSTCDGKYNTAKSMLDSGQGKETRSTVLWVATGVAAAATGIFALLLTDWSGDSTEKNPSEEQPIAIGAGPTEHGMAFVMKGRF
jgi:tetratricopeptide (TPR) repeat protein